MTIPSSPNTPEASVIAEVARLAAIGEMRASAFTVGGRDLHLIHKDYTPQSLEAHMDAPFRMKGTIMVEDAESLGKLLAHFDGYNRMVRLSKESLLVIGILNAAKGIVAAWEDHQVHLKLDEHEDLVAWTEVCDKELSQLTLLEFLEDRLCDICQKPGANGGPPTGPTQSIIQGVATELRITGDATFTSKKTLHDGNYVFESSETTKPSVEVPQVFYISVPIFRGSTQRYLIPIRLRYRLLQGRLSFYFKMVNYDRIFNDAWADVKAAVIAALPEGVPYINVV